MRYPPKKTITNIPAAQRNRVRVDSNGGEPVAQTQAHREQRGKIAIIDIVYLTLTAIVCCALISGCLTALGSYRATRHRLAESTTRLKRLKAQDEQLEQRLAYLKSSTGREQLLRERGFVRENERILLFSDTSGEEQAPVQKKKSLVDGIAHAADQIIRR